MSPSPGRSPRARGSPESRVGVVSPSGPIPACAGEPAPGRGVGCGSRADPRVRGGAKLIKRMEAHPDGRSPRARGSLLLDEPDVLGAGPIPACAGEPRAGSPR